MTAHPHRAVHVQHGVVDLQHGVTGLQHGVTDLQYRVVHDQLVREVSGYPSALSLSGLSMEDFCHSCLDCLIH